MKKFPKFLSILLGVFFASFVFAGCNETPSAKLVSIELLDQSISTTVNQFDTLDLNNINVEAKFSDDTTKTIYFDDVTLSTEDEGLIKEGHLFNTDVCGTYVLTITYQGKTVDVNITVNKYYVSCQAVATEASALTVLQFGEIDQTKFSLVETYSDGSTRTITEGLTFGNFDTSFVGTYPLEVSYNGHSAFIDVEIVNWVKSVSIKSGSIATLVEQNVPLNTSGIVFVEKYSDDSEIEITEGLQISNFDVTRLGQQTLSVTYNGRTAEITIVVNEHLESITVKNGTLPTSVLQYHDFDYSNLVIITHSSNGAEDEVSYAQHSGDIKIQQKTGDNYFNTTTVDTTNTTNNTIKIVLTVGNETLSVEYEFTIVALTGIAVKAGTLPASVLQYHTYDVGDGVIIATYANEATEELTIEEVVDNNTHYNAIVRHDETRIYSSLDTTTAGEKELIITFAYYLNGNSNEVNSISTTHTVLVKELKSIAFGEDVQTYKLKYVDYDTSNITVVATYGTGDNEETENMTVNANLNGTTLTYEYYEKQAFLELTVYDIVSVQVKDADENPIVGYRYIEPKINEMVQNGAIKLYVTTTYENNDVVTYNTDDNKSLYFVFQNSSNNGSNNDIFYGHEEVPGRVRVYLTILLDYLGTAEYTNYDIEETKLLINGEEPTRLYKGEEISVEDISISVTWSDNTTRVFTYNEDGENYKNGNDIISTDSLDTQTSGMKTYSITINGIMTEGIPYEVAESDYDVTGYKYPAFVDAYRINLNNQNTYTDYWEGGNKGFTLIDDMSSVEDGIIYKVGSDNAFVYSPRLTILRASEDFAVDITDFSKSITVYLYDEVNKEFIELTDDEMQDYVTVTDEINYQFTNAAENKIFKLKVVPYSMTEDEEETVYETEQTEFIFQVVSGWNAYSVADLSIIDNTNARIDTTNVNNTNVDLTNYDESGKWTNLKNANGIALNNSSTTLILHTNMNITASDIPSIHTYEKNGNRYMIDSLDDAYGFIYTRTMGQNETFTIEGNYFTINASGLPHIIRERDQVEDNPADVPVVAHTTLIRILGDRDGWTNGVANAENQHFILNNVAMFGNSNNSENNENWGGVMFAKINTVNSNINNCVSKSWYVSFLFEGFEKEAENLQTVLTNTNCFDANNCLLYIWATRHLSMDNCVMIGAGGPALIVDHKIDDVDGDCPSNVAVKDTIIQSWVTGQESWFNSFGEGAGTLLAMMQGLNQLYDNPYYQKEFRQVHVVDDNGTPVEVEFMNIIALYKSGDMEDISTENKQNITGSFVDNTMVKDAQGNDTEVRYYGPVYEPSQATNGLAIGYMDASTIKSLGYSYLMTTNGSYGIPGTDGWAIAPDVQTVREAQDYLYLFIKDYDISIIFGFYDIPANS